MAKRHVVLYYLQVENQYKEELENLKELQELLEEGKVEEWEVEQCKESIENLKTAYETIASVIAELNRPNTNTREDKKFVDAWYNEFKCASKEALINENKDCLVTIKNIIKKAKDRK